MTSSQATRRAQRAHNLGMPRFIEPIEQNRTTPAAENIDVAGPTKKAQVPDYLVRHSAKGCVLWKRDKVQNGAADHKSKRTRGLTGKRPRGEDRALPSLMCPKLVGV